MGDGSKEMGTLRKIQGNARNKNSTVKEIKNALMDSFIDLLKNVIKELSMEICKRKMQRE